jgi:molybdopterin biosynthesis enzyme
VRPFRPARIAAVVQERLDERALVRFRQVLGEKVAWFGASLVDVRTAPPEAEAVAAALEEVVRQRAELIVMAGTRAMDPLDPAFMALDRLGAPLERYGVPAHPGSLLWLARLGAVPIVGMPACGLFSQATTFDLVLPRLLAGQEVSGDSLADLGHGGLLTKDLAFRFPPYRSESRRGEVD